MDSKEELFKSASLLAQMKKALSANPSTITEIKSTAASQRKRLESQASPADIQVLILTTKESSQIQQRLQNQPSTKQQLQLKSPISSFRNQKHTSLSTTMDSREELLKNASLLAQMKKNLSANRSTITEIKSTAASQRKGLENQASPAHMTALILTTKESSKMQQRLQLQLQSQPTQRTTSNQLLGLISLATTTRKSEELFRTASRLANPRKALSANRSTLSNPEAKLTATFPRRQSENQESPKETMVLTPTTKESSMQQQLQLKSPISSFRKEEHTSPSTTME